MTAIEANAHCDGPCGVYDPASARVAAEAVQSMTKKMLTLAANHSTDCGSAAYINTMSRYAAIKEEEAHKCKEELLVLWTDFSNHNTWKTIQISTTYFGRLLNYAVRVRLRFPQNTRKNLWML